MANHASDDLTYFLVIGEAHREYLGAIRHWHNLKVGVHAAEIWMKGFDYAQLNSSQVKTIPHKKLFYEKGGKLFPLNSLLPVSTIPSLLWTPADRAFSVKLPTLNHNYFGIQELLDCQLVNTAEEREAVAMIVDPDLLGDYLRQAPAVRLRAHTWCILDNYTALILGRPLLPLTGQVFWPRDAFLLPAGQDFELHSLTTVYRKKLGISEPDRIVFMKNGHYFRLAHSDLQPLSLASYRTTFPKTSFET